MLVDGTGAAPRVADVGVLGDRIVAIGDLRSRTTRKTIDAHGAVVCPGFVDVLGQSGATVLVDGGAESHVRQGVTSEIVGEVETPALWSARTVGDVARAKYRQDWSGVGEYLRALDRRGLALNLGTFAPASMVRQEVIGLAKRAPTGPELEAMRAAVERAMREGAFGVASALVYPPGRYASTAELVALAEVAGRAGGVYATHVRNEASGLVAAIDEAIEIGERAKSAVLVFHLKAAGRANWGAIDGARSAIDAARGRGLDVSACVYPYTAAEGSFTAFLPDWAHEGGRAHLLARLVDPRDRARLKLDLKAHGPSSYEQLGVASVPTGADASVVGRRLADLARERGQDPVDVLLDLIATTRGRARPVNFMMSERDVREALTFPWVSVCSDSPAVKPDGELGDEPVHPRSYGTFARVLGRYVRDDGTLGLAEAVRKMTSLPATQVRLRERGTVREGYFADLVVFDPQVVSDVATYEHPHRFAKGVAAVIVNGVVEVDKGVPTGARGGHALYGPGAAPAAFAHAANP